MTKTQLNCPHCGQTADVGSDYIVVKREDAGNALVLAKDAGMLIGPDDTRGLIKARMHEAWRLLGLEKE